MTHRQEARLDADDLTYEQALETVDYLGRRCDRYESMAEALKDAADGLRTALGEIRDAAEGGYPDVRGQVAHIAREAQAAYGKALDAWDKAHPQVPRPAPQQGAR